MNKIEFARKKHKHEVRRKKERKLKKQLCVSELGRLIWKTRKQNSVISALVEQGYTEDNACIKIRRISHLFN